MTGVLRPPRGVTGVARDTSGTALIEFAMVLPFLLLLFLGGYQLLDASACKRRVAITTRAVADLISQNERVTEADITASMAASAQIMAPYNVANAQIRVSQIKVNNNRRARVQWSRGANRFADNALIRDWPGDMDAPDTYYIYSEVTYSYRPAIGNLVAPFDFTQKLIMLPRKSERVEIS